MESVNPATGETVETYENHSRDDVEAALVRAADTQQQWESRSITERQQAIAAVADVLGENQERYAQTITAEMGKPITQSRSEVEKCAWVCEYYAERGAEHLQDEQIGGPPSAKTKRTYEPLGAVLAVMPWNFPFWQVFRFAAPALTAGNVGLLKHASNVPGCALAIEDCFRDAGFPDGAFTTLLVDSEMVEDVIEDERVAATTLTGSGPAGSAVGASAGANRKKSVLELGGSDPFVVLEDADLDAAARTGVWARNLNGGQSCIAAKRFVVVDSVYEEFLDRFLDSLEALTVDDPTDEQTDVGPQATTELMNTLQDQVETSVEAGASLEVGGAPLETDGSFYPPTVLTDVPDGCPADTEELFGPVATVYRVDDEAAAIEKANDTSFGLGASLWTEDFDRGEQLAQELEAGCVFVNELVKSDPRLPFGGIKDSGYGRELSADGIREFVNRKTVWVETGDPTTPL